MKRGGNEKYSDQFYTDSVKVQYSAAALTSSGKQIDHST